MMTLQDLDLLLGYLYNNRDFALFEDIHKGFNEIREITKPDLLILFDKLEKDEYLFRKPATVRETTLITNKVISEKPMPIFKLSFKGEQFYKDVPKDYKDMPYQYQGFEDLFSRQKVTSPPAGYSTLK